MILSWVGIYLVYLILVFQGSIVISSWAFRLLGYPEQGGTFNVVGLLIVVGSPIGAGLLTWWTYRYFSRHPRPWPEPEPVVRYADDDERDTWTAARIGRITTLGTGVGAALGIGLAIVLAYLGKPEDLSKNLRPLIMAPFTMGGAGYFLSLALACFLVPDSFLTGPFGQRYLALIGTRNVTVARVACLLVALVIGGPLLSLTILGFLAIRE